MKNENAGRASEFFAVSAVFLLLVVLFFWREIFFSRFLAGGDPVTFNLPLMSNYAQYLKNRQFLIWGRNFGMGMPMLAESQTGVFYPLNMILYYIFPALTAYTLSTVIHFFLLLLFTYIFARIYLDKISSTFAAVAFGCGGFFSIHMGHIWALPAGIWLPLILFSGEKYLRTKKMFFMHMVSLATGMMLLAGHFTLAAYSLVFALFYFLWRVKREGKGFRPGIFILIALAAGTAVSSFQLMATRELKNLSSISGAGYISLPPHHLITLIFPSLLRFAGGWIEQYWLLLRTSFGETYLYFGISTFFLIFFSFRLFKTNEHVCFWLAALAVSIIASFGRFSPFYAIFKLIPIVNCFHPARISYVVSFAAAMLAGHSLFALRQKSWNEVQPWIRKIGTRFFAVAGILFFAGLLVYLLIIINEERIIQMGRDYVDREILGRGVNLKADVNYYYLKVNSVYAQLRNAIPEILRGAVLWLPVLAASYLTLLLTLKKQRHYELLIFVLAIDLILAFNQLPHKYLPRKALKYPSPVMDCIKNDSGTDFRIVSFLGNYPSFDNIQNFSSYFNINHRDLQRINDKIYLALKGRNPEAYSGISNFMNIFNVKYLILPYPLEHKNLKPVYGGFDERLVTLFPDVFTDKKVYLYENVFCLPRIYFVNAIEIFEEDEKLLERMSDADFDFKNTGLAGYPLYGFGKTAGNTSADYKVISYANTEIKLKVETDHPVILVLSDLFYPGWHSNVPLFKINYLCRGLFVEKSGIVHLNYKPFYFNFAYFIPMLLLFAGIVFSAFGIKR